MGTRLAAGILGLCVVLPILVWGGNLWVGLLMGFVVAVGLDEFAAMAMPDHKLRARLTLIPTGLLVHAAVTWMPPNYALIAVGFALMVALVVPMFAQADLPKAGEEASRSALGLLYAPVLLAPLAYIHARPDGIALTFLILAVTWLGDTGAYFAGRFFGKTKLFERVSPKKTVEGFVGGLVLSVVGGAVVKVVGNPDLTWAEILLVSAVMDIFGVVGDLAESLLKRAWGVKDSGWIMPGHGGILDRIDSLLFTAPLLWAYLTVR